MTSVQRDDNEPQVRAGWLLAIGLVGVALVAVALYLDLVVGRQGMVPATALNAGTGFLLFAVLFYAEKRLVVRETSQLKRAITWTDEQIRALASKDPDELVDPEAAEAARRWVQAVIDGRYREAWDMSHPAWRLARIQAWIWNNRDTFGYDLRDLQGLANDLFENESDAQSWQAFIDTESGQFIEAWGDIDLETWGTATAKRRRGPGFEIVLLTPLHEHREGFIVTEPTLIKAKRLLMYRSDDGWQLASHVGEALPSPGWPPAWWAEDPAAAAWERERSERA